MRPGGLSAASRSVGAAEADGTRRVRSDVPMPTTAIEEVRVFCSVATPV